MKDKKNTGSYYTPPYLAKFIAKRVIGVFESISQVSVLEPSVGDGSFLEPLKEISGNIKNLTALDINRGELKKAEQRWGNKSSKFIVTDFLKFKSKEKFSFIIGNPPYIKKNLLSEEQIKRCKEIHLSSGLPEISVKNIWTAFILKSCFYLKDNGILAFVLPSELLQVKFAKEIRSFLKTEFERIEIFTFNDLMFDCKGQDTILLFAYKKAKEKGEYFTNIENRNFLVSETFKLRKNNILVDSQIKWTHHFLSTDDINLLNTLRTKLKQINSYCESKPGIVTAANKFFIVNKEKEKKHGLSKYTKSVIQRGLFLNGGIVFKQDDLKRLEDSELPTRLLYLTSKSSTSKRLAEYINTGVEQGIHLRYKCKERANWYMIPNVTESPEAFFFKRCHHYPKLMKNETDALVTDTAYIVKMRDSYDLNSFIFSFYNSLTLAFAEIDGRYYGGGVLELTPNEFKNLPIPYTIIESGKFEDFVQKFESKKDIEALLNYTDKEILGNSIGLSDNEIGRIKEIRQKLLKKRMR